MGCETCKIGEGLGNEFINNQKLIEDSNGPQWNNGILQPKERDIWCESLMIEGIPEDDFWEKNKEVQHTCFAQIKKDIPRSFPNTTFFVKKSNLNKFQLLLKKFALYFPKLGYTQGLNFVGGYLLIAGFSDRKAFQILCSLVIHDKMMLLGLYEDEFPLNRLYCAIFWKLLQKRLPKTASKIIRAKVPDQSWIFQWFMSFFLYCFPVEFVKKLIDYVIVKKQFSMVIIAIGIINTLKQDINQLNDPDEFDFFQFFDNLKSLQFCRQKIDISKVINYANSFTKLEIAEALADTKLKNNLYYVYFLRQNQRKQIWKSIIEKQSRERKIYKLDPCSSEYRRDTNAVEHLERFLLKKSRLYLSRTDSRFSSQFSSQIRTSNFTVKLDNIQEVISNESQKLSHFFKENKDVIKDTEVDGTSSSHDQSRHRISIKQQK